MVIAWIRLALTWKQKLAFSFPLETGGSWRKSPQTISWMPPNGSVDLLTDLRQHTVRRGPYVTEGEHTDCTKSLQQENQHIGLYA